MLACHFLSLLAPRLKSLPCLNTLPLPFRPILRRAEWAWTRYKICKRTLKKCLMRVGDFRVHFDFKWKPKAKARYCKPISPKWISSEAAMFSSSFTALSCFFQTVWAGEEALGAGLVAFPGAILPSRGSSFRKAKIWTSLMTQCLKLLTPNTGSQGSIPGWGTRSHMPHLKALEGKNLKNKKKASQMPQ